MSLINDMLNDLEARRANDLKRQGLQGEVRPLPRLKEERVWPFRVLIGALCMGGFATLAYFYWPLSPVSPSTVATQAAAPVVAPTIPPPLAAQAPAVEVQAPVVDPRSLALPGEMLGMRTATELAKVPVEATSTTLVTVTTIRIATTTTIPALRGIAPAPKTGEAPPAIDKRVVFASPRERFEVEVRNATQSAAAGKVGEAVEQLRDILRQDPGFSLARQALLRILLEQRRVDEMIGVLSEGLDLQPAQTGWAVSLARLWIERGDYVAAQRILARSYPHATANAEYLGFFAHVQYKQNHPREAAELYQAAARVAPGEGRWWLGLGVALEADGRMAEARDAYRRALATNSLNPDLSALAEQKLR